MGVGPALIKPPSNGDDSFGMIKHLLGLGVLLGMSISLTSPAAAQDCGLLALLGPCTPAPPVPVVAPLLDPVLAPAPAPAPAPVPVVAETVPAPPAATAAAVRIAVPAAADRLLQLVNEERARAGRGPAAAVDRIAAIAAGHSEAMAVRHDIWHNAAYMSAATRQALGARALGENVAMNGSVEGAHQRLMASAGHRANILDARFDSVGIAVVRDEAGMLYITQDFASLQGRAAAAPIRPATPKPPAATPARVAPATGPRGGAVAPGPSPAAPAAAPAVPSFVVAAVPADALPAPAGAGDDPHGPGGPSWPARHLPAALVAGVLLCGVALVTARLGVATLALS